MTTEQAIKELKSDRELYGSDIVYAGDGTPEGDLMLALDMGITALEKQILKKVENYAIDCHGYMIYDCECPSCKTEHKEMYPFAYCPHCGQALDWGNYETPDPDDYCSYGELKEGDDK